MTAETAVPDVTLNGFKPTRAAWEAFQAFRPRSAGGRPADTAAWAATVILYTDLSEPVNALVRHYVHRQSVLVGSETPRHRPVQPWDEDHRARVLEAHRETLRCLMIVLLAPRHINPDVIAPGDFPGLAAIAVGNSRPTQ